MALPKQVQRQLEEAEELEKSMKARKAPESEEGEEVEAETSEEKTGKEAEQAPETEKEAPADTSPTDVAADFEQKYRTLQGKYNAEVPGLQKQVRDLSQELDALRRQLAEKQKAEEPTKAKEKVSYVTDEDRAEFGEELIEVQRRVAREVAAEQNDLIEAQKAEIEALKARLDETGGEVGQMSFAQRLYRAVPDFDEVDRDPRWIKWLDEHDPMLRGPRRDQAKAAFDAGDADAVAHYVALFKESITDTTEQPRQRQNELEKQVTPNRTASSTAKQTTSTQGKKVYSTREIENGWAKLRTLNSRGKLDEAAKLEAELTAAYLEGRVRA